MGVDSVVPGKVGTWPCGAAGQRVLALSVRPVLLGQGWRSPDAPPVLLPVAGSRPEETGRKAGAVREHWGGPAVIGVGRVASSRCCCSRVRAQWVQNPEQSTLLASVQEGAPTNP